MSTDNEIIGFFSCDQPLYSTDDEATEKLADEQGEIFRSYLYGKNGIEKFTKKLKHKNYGKDLVLILYEFHIKPFPELLTELKTIDNYRKKEKAIGVRIFVNDKNFFNKTEKGRYNFLKQELLEKLDLLVVLVNKRKFDTKITLLKADLEKVLNVIKI